MVGYSETLGHILSKCTAHAWTLHKTRHDRVLAALLRAVGTKMGLNSKGWSKPNGTVRPGVVGGRGSYMLVDQAVPTAESITERRPDLIIRTVSGRHQQHTSGNQGVLCSTSKKLKL